MDGEAQVSNFQLHPRSDGSGVAVRQHKTFDNPAIPPSFGFTTEFQEVFYDDLSDPAILERLEREYVGLPTPYIYELARRTALSNPERALGYYFLAEMRMAYDAGRCANAEAREAVSGWDRFMLPGLAPFIRRLTPKQSRLAVSFALEREASMPAATRPWWVCYTGLQNYQAALAGNEIELALKPEAEWPAVRQQIRSQMQTLAAAQTQ